MNRFNIRTMNEKVVHCKYNRYIILDLITFDYVVVNKQTYNKLLKEYREFYEVGVEEDLKDSKNSFVDPVFVTGFDCNYRCAYCYQGGYKRIDDRMQKEDIASIKKFYGLFNQEFGLKTKINEISFIGGEPLLKENFKMIESVFDEFESAKIRVITNGAEFELYKDMFLKHRDRIDSIVISVDGDKELHLRYRKPLEEEYYDEIWKAVDFLTENHIPLIINSVYHPEDNREYVCFFDKLEEHGWKEHEFSVNLTLDIDKAFPGSEYLEKAKVSIGELKELDHRANRVNSTIENYTELTMYSIIKNRNFSIPYKACGVIGNPSFSFFPNGDIYICLLAKNNEMMKVGTYKPEVTIDKERIRRLFRRDIRYMDKCMECEYKYFCRGGCVAQVCSDGGDIYDGHCGRWKEAEYEKSLEKVLERLIEEEIVFQGI